MTNVSNIGASAVHIGTNNFNRAGIFDKAFNNYSAKEWNGSAKQEIGNASAGEQQTKTAEAEAGKPKISAQDKNSKGAKMRSFYARDFSTADYGMDYRVGGWFARAPAKDREQTWPSQSESLSA